MKHLSHILLILTLVLVGCGGENKTLLFSDFVDIENIERIEMTNNSGSFVFTESQLQDIRLKLADMPKSNGAYKMGGIGFNIIIDGVEHYLLND